MIPEVLLQFICYFAFNYFLVYLPFIFYCKYRYKKSLIQYELNATPELANTITYYNNLSKDPWGFIICFFAGPIILVIMFGVLMKQLCHTAILKLFDLIIDLLLRKEHFFNKLKK